MTALVLNRSYHEELLMATRKRKPAKPLRKENFERHHFNYGRWTKSRFSEAVTVTGPSQNDFSCWHWF